MKIIPLSVPMGGDCTCCVHGDQCKAIADTTITEDTLRFRCPLTVQVDDDVHYAGDWHESCFVLLSIERR